uniref:Uncharacterized protein n=1 Tax=Glossina austeni TaxID=7395 RepID=A0A1A9VCD4_GLOAU
MLITLEHNSEKSENLGLMLTPRLLNLITFGLKGWDGETANQPLRQLHMNKKSIHSREIMACCMKASKRDDNPCCTDVRRCCFGKNHDAFFCYNYEKAKNCQSPWHPRRPDVYYVKSRFGKPVMEEPRQPEPSPRYYQPEPEPYGREPNKFESYDSMMPSRNVDTGDRQVCYCGHRNEKVKKKYPGLKVAREYLQRCLLQRLTVDWTHEDDRNLNDCIYHQLAKINGPDHVIEVLDDISAQKKMEPVFRSWINQLKQFYFRPRGGSSTNLDQNCAMRSTSTKFLQSSEEAFSTIAYPLGGRQYHIAGEAEKFKESLVYNSPGSGKSPKTRKYRPEEEECTESFTLSSPDAGKLTDERNYNTGGKGAMFDNSSNYDFQAKGALPQNKRFHLDTIPSDEFAQSDKNDNYFAVYEGNGCNENTYNSNGFVKPYIGGNGKNSKNETIEQTYLGREHRQLLRGDGFERLCPSHNRAETDKEMKKGNRSTYLPSFPRHLNSDDENPITAEIRHGDPLHITCRENRGCYEDVMDLLQRNLCNNDKLACCGDARRGCFGKRHDAFFCYNDDKAYQGCCPSMWHPRNPTHIKIVPNFIKCDNRDKLTNRNFVEPRRAEPYRSERYRDEVYRSEPYRNERYRDEIYRSEPNGNERYRDEIYRSEPYRSERYRDESDRSAPYRNERYRDENDRSDIHRVEISRDEPYRERYSPDIRDFKRQAEMPTQREPNRYYKMEVCHSEPCGPELSKVGPWKFKNFDSIPHRDATFSDIPGCYCGHGKSTSKKSTKTPGLKATKQYLKRCLLTRLAVGWTEDDDLNLAECVYHHLSKIKGPNGVIEILDEISAQRRIDSVLRSWINKLKRIFSRPRGGQNSKALLNTNYTYLPRKFHQTNQESFNMVPQFIGGKQCHIGGWADKYKNSFSYKPLRLSGKTTETQTYNIGGRGKFNPYSKYNLVLKASLSQHERASDGIPSDESTQSDENNYLVKTYNPRYLANGGSRNACNSIRYVNTYDRNNDRNSKHEIFEQNYLDSDNVRQPLQEPLLIAGRKKRRYYEGVMDSFMEKNISCCEDVRPNRSPAGHSRSPAQFKIVGNLTKCDGQGRARNRNFVGLVTQTSSLTRLDPARHKPMDYDSRHSDPGRRDSIRDRDYEFCESNYGHRPTDYASEFDRDSGYMKPGDSDITLAYEPKKRDISQDNRPPLMTNHNAHPNFRVKKSGAEFAYTPRTNNSFDWIPDHIDPKDEYERDVRNTNLKTKRVPGGEKPYSPSSKSPIDNRRDYVWDSNCDILEETRTSSRRPRLRSYEFRNAMSKDSDGLEQSRERGGSRERDVLRDRNRERERSRDLEEKQFKFSSKFKGPSLSVVKEYLQKCLMQRLTVDWTEEDDLQLANYIYMHLSNMRDSNYVCAALDEISKEKRLEPMLKSYVDKLRRIYRISGLCERPREQSQIEMIATPVASRRSAAGTSEMVSSGSQQHVTKLTGNDNRQAPMTRADDHIKKSGNECYNFKKEGIQKPHAANAGKETYRSEVGTESKMGIFLPEYKEREARMYSPEHDAKERRSEKYINSLAYEAPEGRKYFETRRNGRAENNPEGNGYIGAGKPSPTYGYNPAKNYPETYRYDSAGKYSDGHSYHTVGKYSEAYSHGMPGTYLDARSFDKAGRSSKTYGRNPFQKYPETYSFNSLEKYAEDHIYPFERRNYVQLERHPQLYNYAGAEKLPESFSYNSIEKYPLTEHYAQYKNDKEGQRDKANGNFGKIYYNMPSKSTQQLPTRIYACKSCGMQACQCPKMSKHGLHVCQKCFTHPCRCNKSRNGSLSHSNVIRDDTTNGNNDVFPKSNKKGIENHGYMQQDRQELRSNNDTESTAAPVSVRCVLERERDNGEGGKTDIIIHGRVSRNITHIDGYDLGYENSAK